VPSLQIAYGGHASVFNCEVLNGLLSDRVPPPAADYLEQRPHGAYAKHTGISMNPVVRPKKERTLVRGSGQELNDLGLSFAQIHHGRITEREVRSFRLKSQSN